MTGLVDAAAHPVVRVSDELREYMPEPWRSRSFPGPERYEYAWPEGENLADAELEGALSGSDPVAFRDHLRAAGSDVAILLPLTRGLLPNVDLATAICAATNDWLASWMNEHDDSVHYYGSIRVNPADPAAAVREIERWAGHPRMVQVAVPTQAHAPYGQRAYFPLWEAAALRSLPIAVHLDGGASIDFPPTPVGYPRLAIEFAVLAPLIAAFHLTSLIAEGVFARLPDLRFVFADGGLDAMTPIVWRLDKDWRATRDEVPWTTQLPSRYVRDHVRFVAHRLDAAPVEHADAWHAVTDAGELLMYGSNYPAWNTADPSLFDDAGSLVRERILSENARELYALADVGAAT